MSQSASVDVRGPRLAAWVTSAATGVRPGCELHLLLRRALPARTD